MKKGIDSSTFKHVITVFGLIALFSLVLLTGCPKPTEQPVEKPDTTDQTASDTSDDTSSDDQEQEGRLFNIMLDEMVGDTHMLGIVCEPEINAFTLDEIKNYCGILAERYKAMPKIHIEFFTMGEEPGVNTPTYIFDWTPDTGLVQVEN